jgi:hypothetical protein
MKKKVQLSMLAVGLASLHPPNAPRCHHLDAVTERAILQFEAKEARMRAMVRQIEETRSSANGNGGGDSGNQAEDKAREWERDDARDRAAAAKADGAAALGGGAEGKGTGAKAGNGVKGAGAPGRPMWALTEAVAGEVAEAKEEDEVAELLEVSEETGREREGEGEGEVVLEGS